VWDEDRSRRPQIEKKMEGSESRTVSLRKRNERRDVQLRLRIASTRTTVEIQRFDGWASGRCDMV
jgi:hypothetical protein